MSPLIPRISAPLSRRQFLGIGAALAGKSLLRPGRDAQSPADLTMPRGTPRSRVIQVRSPHATDGPVVHPTIIREMLEVAMTALTGAKDAAGAWHAVLKPDDVIGIKFNRSGQAALGTTDAVADALINALVDAGWRTDQLVCIEAPAGVQTRHRTRPARPGYAAKPTEFASGSDQLSSVLEQITALIDVPFLKTHNIAGMTCALKNLSHAFVKHPARYHAHGCAPFIGDIVAIPEIRNKLRLCLVDALRVVYDGGPEANVSTISNEGSLIASFDPVATDATGLATLNDIRGVHGLPPVARSAANLGYLADAHLKGLGVAVPHGIDLIRRNPS